MASNSSIAPAEQDESLAGKCVAIVGKLAGMSRRDAQQLIRKHGANVADTHGADATATAALAPIVQIIVVGEGELPLAIGSRSNELDDATRSAIDEGRIEVITETQLWQRLGLVEIEQHVHPLYTPAMLAELLQVPLAIVRRWHRRGLIVPRREVRRLPYFDFQEVATARRLAELLAAGMSPQAIETKLAELARYVPGVARPLAQLSVIVEGKNLLLRQGDGLIGPGGQLWFTFGSQSGPGPTDHPEPHGDEDAVNAAPAPGSGDLSSKNAEGLIALPLVRGESTTPAQMLHEATLLEDEGQFAAAAEMYRAALMGGGPVPDVCFALAELLYRMGDIAGARERYYMAIELDEEYVEARANLGCVLAETGERELAVAAFEGALAFHDQYPDVHYHLARTLDDLDRSTEADEHWRAFLELAPESPWAETARRRLANS